MARASVTTGATAAGSRLQASACSGGVMSEKRVCCSPLTHKKTDAPSSDFTPPTLTSPMARWAVPAASVSTTAETPWKRGEGGWEALFCFVIHMCHFKTAPPHTHLLLGQAVQRDFGVLLWARESGGRAVDRERKQTATRLGPIDPPAPAPNHAPAARCRRHRVQTSCEGANRFLIQ